MESSIVPGIYKEEELEGKISVPTEESYDMVETLEKQEGILVGHSSAGALLGALKLAATIKSGVIVTIFPVLSAAGDEGLKRYGTTDAAYRKTKV